MIDADELREQLVWCKEQAGRFDTYWDDVIERVDSLPTVDAVAVVRCKDCKYRLHLGPTEHYPETYVCRIDNVSGTRKAYRDEWFCADGERRTDEDD
jgi:hypothetical protein